MSDALIVPLHSRRLRRAQALQKSQHAIPAAGLLVTGVQSLAQGATGVALLLAIAEIVTSGVLILTLLRTLRRHFRPSSPGAASHGHSVDWSEIWAASMFAAEAWERWQSHHHVARPIILMAAVTLVLGLNHERVARNAVRRRSLILADDDLTVGGPPWRRFRVRWADLADISITPSTARLRSVTGKTRNISFEDLENAADVRAALEVAQKRLAGLLHPPAAVTPKSTSGG
ncbi:MAG: hypothetical protein ABI647_23145 [Gemmatimonadota bacterium]